MEERVQDDPYSFGELWEQAGDILDGMRKEIGELLSAQFRGLHSREDQLLFLQCQPIRC
jgi:hypothetical protein